MKKVSFVNMTVFLLFFGLALFEAMQKKNWPLVGLFGALGILSLWADIKKPQ